MTGGDGKKSQAAGAGLSREDTRLGQWLDFLSLASWKSIWSSDPSVSDSRGALLLGIR